MSEFDYATVSKTESERHDNITVSEIPDVPTNILDVDDCVQKVPEPASFRGGKIPEGGPVSYDRFLDGTKDFYNASGCADPTAYRAIRNVDQEYRRFQDLLHTIWSVCKLAGFRVEGHITLVDKRTGRVWK